MTHIILIYWQEVVIQPHLHARGAGMWWDPDRTATSQEQLTLWKGQYAFGGRWSSLQHVAQKAMHDLTCFFLLPWRPLTYLSCSMATRSHSLTPIKQTSHDTPFSISWAPQTLPVSGTLHILIDSQILLFPLFGPFWFCWDVSNNSFSFNLNISSSERLSWLPPSTNTYLPVMFSHGAMFFFFLIVM